MKEEKTKMILLPILLKSNVVYFISRKGTKCQLDFDYLAIKKNSKKNSKSNLTKYRTPITLNVIISEYFAVSFVQICYGAHIQSSIKGCDPNRESPF